LSTSFGWGKGGNVTSAGWQVTLCDPMWHVSSRSGVATLRTATHLLLTSVLGSQPAGDVSHKLGGRLPLLSARPAVTVNSLPETVTRQRRDCDLNPGPSAPESSTLTTRLPSHPWQYRGTITVNSCLLVSAYSTHIDFDADFLPLPFGARQTLFGASRHKLGGSVAEWLAC